MNISELQGRAEEAIINTVKEQFSKESLNFDLDNIDIVHERNTFNGVILGIYPIDDEGNTAKKAIGHFSVEVRSY